jgi:hypothetical protein
MRLGCRERETQKAPHVRGLSSKWQVCADAYFSFASLRSASARSVFSHEKVV